MGKFYKILLLSSFFVVLSLSSYAQQINLIRFNNSANYTPGSGVSVIINPTGVFDLNNQFILELSNPGGTFTSPTVLNTLDEFYVPAINGTLPNGLTAGTYKLRVRATNPVLNVETNSFTVVSGSGIGIPKFISTLTNVGSSTFNCLSPSITQQNNINCNNISSNNIFGKLDVAAGNITSVLNNNERRLILCDVDATANYTINLINISNQTSTQLPLNLSTNQFFIPNDLAIGTYVIEVEKLISNTISVQSNIFLFHGNATNLNNLTAETVCIGNEVYFSIDITNGGIGRNYMGSKYTIDFGDSTPVETYTHSQILNIFNNGNNISHIFDNVSCSVGSGNLIGYFYVRLKLFNKGIFNSGNNNNYCDEYYENGNGAQKEVNTNRAPIADFDLPNKQCVSTVITAQNTTILGQYGTTACLSIPEYYWYIKRPTDTDFIAIDNFFNPSWLVGDDLVIPAAFVNIPGCWQIKLEAQNAGAGCTTTTEMIKTIKIEAVPTPSFTNTPQSPICAGTAVLFTNTSNVLNIPCQEPVYSWTITPVTGTPATSSGYQFVSPSTATSQNANILFTQPGSYSVVLNVTNSCGTFPSTPTIIEVFGDPTVTFNPNTLTICDIAPAGYTIDFSQVGTTPTYSVAPFAPTNFTWTVSGTGVTTADYSFVGGTNSNSQYPQINFTAYKTYIITVQVNGNCSGSNQATFTFILKEMPVITNSNLTQTICTGNTTTAINLISNMASGTVFNWTVTATNGITGFTTPGNGSIIPATTLNNPSTTTGTVTYTVTPTNNGCIGNPVNFIITVNPLPTITGTLNVCVGSTRQLTGSATSATSNAWTSSNTSVATVSNSGLVTGVSAGTTIITYTNSNGCQTTATFTVNDLPTITGNLVICANTSTQLTGSATAASSSAWVSSNTAVATVSNTGLVTGVSAGTTTITYTNSNGCQTTVTVTVNPLPTITGTLNVCVGNSTQLTGSATAATSNAWSSSNPAVATVDNSGLVNGISAGTTTITYTNSNGCQTTATVTVNPLPTITGTLNVCVGSTRQLTGSATSATSNAWTSSNTSVATVSNSGLVTGVSAGTTTITYTNSNGCQTTATITVNELPSINGNLVICTNTSTQLTGSATAATSNAWTSSNTAVATVSNTGLVTGVSGGTATITYTNSNGCQTTATVTVNPLPTITGTLNLCIGNSTQLTGSATAASTNAWSSSNTAVATVSNTGLVTGVSPGTTTITYTNSNGCQTTATFTVNDLPTITGNLIICANTSTQLTGSATAAASNAWTSSYTAVATVSNTGLVTGVSGGTSTITYTNSNGCQTTATVTVNPIPTITGTLNICIGNSAQLTGSATAASSNAWTSSNPAVATVDNLGLVNGLSAGTTTITYTNSNGCQTTATVTVNPLPTITGTLNVCVGSTRQLTGSVTAATSNAWSSSNTAVATVSNTGLVTGVSAGTTTITYTNSNGCQTTATITVNELPSINGNLVICANTSTQLTGSATAATSNAWTSSNTSVATVSNTGLVTGVSGGTATITYTNSNGCQTTATVTVNPLPTITGTLNLCIGNSTQLTGSATAATSNAWSSSNTAVATVNNTGLVTGVSAGTTTITYTNSNGCEISTTITINDLPIVTNQTATICSDSPSGESLGASSSVAATTYNITAINQNGLTPSAGNPIV
ncbi:beta strand repeat-containing protein, partial [Flavobacterium sp.]|uniref:beta strand repeat-containing protein n=3 Tax=Flavobacterium sp. TaxID=239 RepID=UPI004047F299